MDSPSRVLLPINKSITKSNPTSNKKEEIKVEKKYKTYSNTVKRQYLHELWKGLIELFNPTYSLHFELELPESEDFLNLFDQTTLQQKNRLLKNILTSHGEDFTEKSLIDWRKKIRSWIEKINKPETRGAPVVPVEKAGDFKKRVEEILDHIPCRSESLLKSELLKVLKSYHDELEGSGKPFNVNTCSKHWWFNYRERNPDIREKWEAIPLERVLNKKTSAKSRTQGRASATISTAGVSLETSPARGEDQSHFDRFHLEMEEEKDEKAQFTLFDEVEGSDYNVNYVKQFAYLFKEDFGANNTEYDIDQFFADMNEDVASGQVYLDSPKY